MIQLLFAFLLFLALSGTMAMIDAAVLSVSPSEVESMVTKKQYGAKALALVKQDMNRAVVVIVVFTNTINILGPIVIGQLATELWSNAIIGVITAVLALSTIIFSEIIPKSFGAHHAPTISRVVAPGIRTLGYVLIVLVWPLERLAEAFQHGDRKVGTEAQIRSLVHIGRRKGFIEQDEVEMIDQAFILNDTSAAQIMTPIQQAELFTTSTSIQEAADTIMRKPYTRYPVMGSSIHEIKGFILARDVFRAYRSGDVDQSVVTIQHEVIIVDGATKADDLLVGFQQRQIHIAVVQENEKTIGIITIEDVLEELVGEIIDEKERMEADPFVVRS